MFHHLPKRSDRSGLFSFCLGQMVEIREYIPMTRFSRQSGCTQLRLDTFVSRRSLTAIAVRRLPFSMLSPSIKKIRSFGSIFVLAHFTGCQRVSLVFVYNCISSQYFRKIFVRICLKRLTYVFHYTKLKLINLVTGDKL